MSFAWDPCHRIDRTQIQQYKRTIQSILSAVVPIRDLCFIVTDYISPNDFLYQWLIRHGPVLLRTRYTDSVVLFGRDDTVRATFDTDSGIVMNEDPVYMTDDGLIIIEEVDDDANYPDSFELYQTVNSIGCMYGEVSVVQKTMFQDGSMLILQITEGEVNQPTDETRLILIHTAPQVYIVEFAQDVVLHDNTFSTLECPCFNEPYFFAMVRFVHDCPSWIIRYKLCHKENEEIIIQLNADGSLPRQVSTHLPNQIDFAVRHDLTFDVQWHELILKANSRKRKSP